MAKPKFGSQKSYNVGDAVWVRGMPLYGVAHIIGLNDGIKRYKENSPAKAGTYEVTFNCGSGILEVEIKHLKPATVKDDQNDQARVAKERLKDQQARDEMDRLLVMLQASKPIENEEEFLACSFSFDPLNQLRAEDYLAVRGGGQLGYAGCPRTDFTPGERVRVRKGVDLKKWGLTTEGQCGTVKPSDPIQSIFPVCPSQPKGIHVKWDNGIETLIYVTNLEPE